MDADGAIGVGTEAPQLELPQLEAAAAPFDCLAAAAAPAGFVWLTRGPLGPLIVEAATGAITAATGDGEEAAAETEGGTARTGAGAGDDAAAEGMVGCWEGRSRCGSSCGGGGIAVCGICAELAVALLCHAPWGHGAAECGRTSAGRVGAAAGLAAGAAAASAACFWMTSIRWKSCVPRLLAASCSCCPKSSSAGASAGAGDIHAAAFTTPAKPSWLILPASTASAKPLKLRRVRAAALDGRTGLVTCCCIRLPTKASVADPSADFHREIWSDEMVCSGVMVSATELRPLPLGLAVGVAGWFVLAPPAVAGLGRFCM